MLEVRNLAATIELRSEADKGQLVGYASRFNEPICPYYDWPEFTEIVHPDAFTRTLKERPDVRALRNHDPNLVLARVKNGTLRLAVDATGLGFEADLNLDTNLGRDTRSDVQRGDIDGCSIGFFTIKDDIETDRDSGKITRTLLDVCLIEITPACTFPANVMAEVSLRSAFNSRLANLSARPNNELIRLIRRRGGRRPTPADPRK